MGIGVSGLVGHGRVEGLRLDDGSILGADVVLVAIGVVPETGWLDGSGLELADGVVCAPTLVASPGVVAAGDVARWPHPLAEGTVRLEHRTNAAEQGVHAASSLLAGIGATPFSSVPYFWSDQFDVKIQSIGLPAATDEVRVVAGSIAEGRFVACYGRDGRLSAVVGFNSPRAGDGFPGAVSTGERRSRRRSPSTSPEESGQNEIADMAGTVRRARARASSQRSRSSRRAGSTTAPGRAVEAAAASDGHRPVAVPAR